MRAAHSAKNGAAVRVVAEHVPRSTRGRQQKHVARTVRRPKPVDSGFERLEIGLRRRKRAVAVKRRADFSRILSDQGYGARRPRECLSQRRKVLSLAVAAQNNENAALLRGKALDGRCNGADIRTLGVVNEVDAVDRAQVFDAVGLALIGGKRREHAPERRTGCGRERHGRERIHSVVAAADQKCVFGHESFDIGRARVRSRARAWNAA